MMATHFHEQITSISLSVVLHEVGDDDGCQFNQIVDGAVVGNAGVVFCSTFTGQMPAYDRLKGISTSMLRTHRTYSCP